MAAFLWDPLCATHKSLCNVHAAVCPFLSLKPCHIACGIFVPQTETEPKSRILNRWTARVSPCVHFFTTVCSKEQDPTWMFSPSRATESCFLRAVFDELPGIFRKALCRKGKHPRLIQFPHW